MTAIVVALIAAFSAISAALISLKQNAKINETHKQVSENSHQNDKPTVLDLISDLRDEQRQMNAVIIDHLEWHLEKE